MKNFKMIVPVTILGALSMGNSGCEKEEAKGRTLKMEVEISSLKARTVRMPNGEVIDFPYVVNSLFYRQVFNHDHFLMMNPVPTGQGLADSGGVFKTQAKGDASTDEGMVSANDVAVLERYGFLNHIRKTANDLMSGAKTMNDLVAKSTNSDAELPPCLYDLPQALLGGEVLGFEVTGGVGIGIGYNASGDLAGNVGGKIGFEQSRLELGLRTENPLSNQVIAIGDGVAHQKKTSFGINFIPGIPIGLSFFFNTPITDVIREAMTKGLDNIVAKYASMRSKTGDWNEVWESRVIYDPQLANNDTHVAIRGGFLHGVKEGDTFAISNMHYAWEGAACYTKLKYAIPLTTTPIAEGVVVSVGDNVSVLQIQYLAEGRVLPGAQIKVLKLVQPVAAK